MISKRTFKIICFQGPYNIKIAIRIAVLTLHDFCHAMHQIGYDMKRRVIAEDRVI